MSKKGTNPLLGSPEEQKDSTDKTEVSTDPGSIKWVVAIIFRYLTRQSLRRWKYRVLLLIVSGILLDLFLGAEQTDQETRIIFSKTGRLEPFVVYTLAILSTVFLLFDFADNALERRKNERLEIARINSGNTFSET